MSGNHGAAQAFLRFSVSNPSGGRYTVTPVINGVEIFTHSGTASQPYSARLVGATGQPSCHVALSS